MQHHAYKHYQPNNHINMFTLTQMIIQAHQWTSQTAGAMAGNHTAATRTVEHS